MPISDLSVTFIALLTINLPFYVLKASVTKLRCFYSMMTSHISSCKLYHAFLVILVVLFDILVWCCSTLDCTSLGHGEIGIESASQIC